MIHRLPFGNIDSKWKVRWKDLWTTHAGPNETYSGYIDYWDEVPWQQVDNPGGVSFDYNHAARAQYLPKYGSAGDYYGVFERCVEVGLPEEYCHHCLGLVQDLIALLEADGIDTHEIEAQYAHGEEPRMVRLRDLFFRNYDPANIGCPIVFSRPMTYNLGGKGHIGDNSMGSFFIHESESCDGTEGFREELAPPPYRTEFHADALWFIRRFKGSSLPELPADARLVMYVIAAGSVPRLKVNENWYFTDPAHSAPYGDPYGFCHRAKKYSIGRVSELGLDYEGENSVIVEHIAPRPETIGCQVVFSFEWGTEIVIKPVTRRKKVAGPSKGGAFGDIVGRWKIMIANLAAEIQGFVDAQPFYKSLEQIIDDAEKLNAEQEELKGLLKAKTDELYNKLDEGNKNYASLVRYLKMKFGPDAPILTKYIPAAEGEVDKTKGDFKPKPEEPEEK